MNPYGRGVSGDGWLTVGEVASLVGLESSALRFYEAQGVVPVAERSAAGYRVYGEADVERFRFVKAARGLGLGLAEIAEVVSARESGSPACVEVQALLGRQIRDTERRIGELRSLLVELRRLAALSVMLPDAPGPDEDCICGAIAASSVGAGVASGT